ncbi:helix-turn-helix domain-containing protein [Fusobacterium varium]
MTTKKLSIVLKQLRESRGLTIMKLAELTGLANGTIGDIETGKSNGSKKSLSKIAEALKLTIEERGILDSAFLGRDVIGSEDPRVNQLNKKERMQFEDLMKENALFFNDENISEEDKEKLFDALQEAFFTVKVLNKRKK